MDKLQRDLLAHDQEGWLHPPGVETDEHNLLDVVKTAGKSLPTQKQFKMEEKQQTNRLSGR